MDVDEVVDNVEAEAERAAGQQGQSVIGRVSGKGESVDDSMRCGVTGEQFGGREGADTIGAETGSEREAKGG